MSKYIILCFFINILINIKSNSKEVQISNPIISDYYDIIYNENQIIAYGTNGIINVSNDNGDSWEIQKIFNRGKIVFMSYEDDSIIAINEEGEIIKCSKNFKNIKIISNLDITPEKRIWTIKKFDENYLVRTINSVSLLDKEFNIIKKELLPSLNEKIYNFTDSLLTRFINNIVVYNNKIIVSIDSAKFMVYDNSLNFIEKWNYSKELQNSLNLVQILVINNKLIFDSYNTTYVMNSLTNKFDTLVHYPDLIKINPKFTPFLRDEIEDKFMILPSQQSGDYKICLIDTNGNLDTTIQILYTSFDDRYGDNVKKTINKVVKKDNRYILLGDRNTIIIVNTEKDKDGNIQCTTNEITKGFGFKHLLCAEPFRYDDKFIFTFKSLEVAYENFMFEINDSNNCLKSLVPQYKLENGQLNTAGLYTYNTVRFRNFNKKTKELNIIASRNAQSGVATYFKTSDFFRDKIEYYSVNDVILANGTFPPFLYTDLLVFDNKYIFVMISGLSESTSNSRLFTYSDNFQSKSEIRLQDEFGKNKKIEYLYSEDNNKYLLVYRDFDKSTLEFKQNNNLLNNPQNLYSYNGSTRFMKYKNIEFGNEPYLIYLLKDTLTFKYSIKLLNLRDYKLYTLNEFIDTSLNDRQVNFDIYEEKIFLSIGNKLLHFQETLENPKWDEYQLPNQGFIQDFMYIHKDYLYCNYQDEINDLNLYRIKLVDSIVNSVEEEINNYEYVFLYPSYPNPSTSEINTEVFWSNAFEIENSDIAVFDLNGNKVSNISNITLDKTNNNKGNIRWNCSGVPSGTYLLKIQRGNNTKSVKMMVE